MRAPDARSRVRQVESTKTSWLTLLRNGGDTDLGAGLVRLATLAAAVHQQEVARQAAGGHEMTDDARADGRAHGAVVAPSADELVDGPLHTEVHR